MKQPGMSTAWLWAFFDDLLEQGRIDEAFTIFEKHPEMYDDGLSDEEALKKFYRYVEEMDN